MKNYRLTLMFVITSLVVITATTFVVNNIVGKLTEDNLIEIAEANSVRDAMHVQSMIRSIGVGNNAASNTTQIAPVPSLAKDSHTESLNSETQFKNLSLENLTGPNGLTAIHEDLAQGFDFSRIDLIDLSGHVVWSTKPANLGLNLRNKPAFSDALIGRTSSNHNTHKPIGQSDRNGDATESLDTYIPLRESEFGRIIAVMGLHRDVSGNVAIQVAETKSAVLSTTIAAMGSLFLLLLGQCMSSP